MPVRILLACLLVAATSVGLVAASDWAFYRAAIAAADGALRADETSSALGWLKAAPPGLRGWEWRYLRALADESRLAVRAHDGAITGVALSGDGRTVATTATDRTVKLWDATTGASRGTLTGATATTWSPAWRHDSSHIAAMSSDGAVRVWDTAFPAGPPIAAFERLGRGLGAVAWSPDGALLAATSWTVEPSVGVQGWVHLWQFDDRRLLWKTQYGVKPIPSVAFRADGLQLAVGTWDAWIGLFDVPGAGRVRPDIRIPFDDEGRFTAVQSVAYTPGGQLVATAKDRLVRVYQSTQGVLEHTFAGHSRWVNGSASSPAGWTVTASSDTTIRVWDSRWPGASRVLHGHRTAVTAIALAPTAEQFVSGDADGTLRWWGAALANVDRTTWRLNPSAVYGVDFTRDGLLAVTASYGGMVAVRGVADGKERWMGQAHTDSANAVAFSPDGSRFATVGNNGQLLVLGSTGERLLGWDAGSGRQVTSVAWSPDGRTIFSPASPPHGVLWDAATGAAIRTIHGRGGSVAAVAFSPNGDRVAIAQTNGDVVVARVATGATAVVSGAHAGGAHAVAFAPSGTLLATAGADRAIRLWRVPGLAPVRVLRGHAELVTGVAFSPDGTRIASSSNDQTVRIWTPSTPEPLITIPFDAQVYGVRFTPDGRRLAVLPMNGTVRLLEAPSYH